MSIFRQRSRTAAQRRFLGFRWARARLCLENRTQPRHAAHTGGQVAELSVQIAEKVLKAKLSDDKAQMDMINRLLDEVSSDNK